MTFFNDLWAKLTAFCAPTKGDSPSMLKKLKDPNALLTPNFSQQTESERARVENENIIHNLQILKCILEEPKETTLESRFAKIQEHLGTPEAYETIRQERWQPNIHCPSCQSTHIQRLAQLPSKSSHNHRYRCLDCQLEFNDDTETPIETGVPPLNVWMQCWYLMGCTDSLSYIAHKLNLDLSLIEVMVLQLQRTFGLEKPLSRFQTSEDWRKQTVHLRAQLQDDLLKQSEQFNANVATAPKDTTEFRRQQNLRRHLSASTHPPSTTTPSSGKKPK